MSIKKILVGFFLLIFSYQLAPVQEVGAFLYNNQMTEEIPHGQDESGLKYPDDSLKFAISTQYLLFKNNFSQDSFLFDKELIIRIITRTSDDITTPPPNQIG